MATPEKETVNRNDILEEAAMKCDEAVSQTIEFGKRNLPDMQKYLWSMSSAEGCSICAGLIRKMQE